MENYNISLNFKILFMFFLEKYAKMLLSKVFDKNNKMLY